MAEHLFDDTFVVKKLDPDGKKFDKVSRVEAMSDDCRTYMQLDVATEVYPMRVDEKFKMVLAETLNLDGTPDTGYFTQAVGETLADRFEYVMQGKVYKIADYAPPKPKEDADTSNKDADTSIDPKVEVFASFGGLLMVLRSDPSFAAPFELDKRVFLLIRKGP
ncbi:hypothetical protein SEVIR_9G013200v4 [Setaria viridis]|uniref:Uncharacterized protein n=2 Tax=Setaria TaxID=4554 RepID=A0A368SDR3_SETIT|nr:DNA-directed RNA polymerases II, IV and V subunit 8B-like [Setaria italica]XP_034576833.1 DNA-directed RNA polymerases II, IV and V subunit 8B-like [Setaria viridis]RCV39960.1 hypothetical protein SETIT_9G013200v2 [Setaria italica]TKV90206.1 hypothetical protein SEVIR_9G013200v2 [Setaria viridis]